MRLLKDLVLIRQDNIVKRSVGGIMINLINEDRNKKPNRGEIIEVGENVTKYKKGDRVIFSQYQGIWLNTDEEKNLVLMTDREIFAKLIGDVELHKKIECKIDYLPQDAINEYK